MALVLLLLGAASMAGLVAKNINDEVRRNFGFVVKMSRTSTQEDLVGVRSALKHTAVRGYEYISPDSILKEEKSYFGDDFARLLDENPYNPEFEVKVNPSYSAADSIVALTGMFKKLPGVEEVISENAVIQGVDSTLRRMSFIFLLASAVLLLVSIALINNTVSLSVYSRRFVIHTMKLVGATPGFIRKPFIIAGIYNGLVAGVISSALLASLRVYLQTIDPLVESALPWVSMAVIFLFLVAIGAGVCVATAAFAANRYLNASYDEMYLK